MKIDYNQDFEKMMTIDDLCDHLGIERKKAYKLVQLDTFPVIKIGKAYIIPKRLYFKWLSEHMGEEMLI